MKKYKAIYFDRDGTIARKSRAKEEEKNEYLGRILNDSTYELTQKMTRDAMDVVIEVNPDLNIYENKIKTLETETHYWNLVHEEILKTAHYNGEITEAAKNIVRAFPYEVMFEPYEEVEEVLQYFKSRSYKIGIISDTLPSLENTIIQMGLGRYIDSCTSSSEVGVYKPDARIFHHALATLNMEAKDCIYIDDYDVESDGARNIGFTAFCIDRTRKYNDPDNWLISNLKQLIEFVEKVLSS